MRRYLTTTAMLLLGACWFLATPAMAELPDPRLATTYSPSPVSPYLNLGYNLNGTSNYQTLVRPMIDGAKACCGRQPRFSSCKRGRRDGRDGVEADSQNATGHPQAGVRRMYYSHFYSGLHSGVPR